MITILLILKNVLARKYNLEGLYLVKGFMFKCPGIDNKKGFLSHSDGSNINVDDKHSMRLRGFCGEGSCWYFRQLTVKKGKQL